MPRRKKVPSLMTACLTHLAKTLDSYWYSGTNSFLLDTPRLLYIVGPFDCLGDDLLKQLLQTLVEHKLMRRHHFQILIHSNLKSLDLGICEAPANHSSVIDIVSIRCQNLTSLNIAGLKNVPPKSLCKLVTNIPQIKSLNLDSTRCDNGVLQVIAKHCPLLKDLSVGACPISDKGVLNLCLGSETERISPVLKCLNILATEVSPSAAATLLIYQCNLQYFGYSEMCSAFVELLKVNQPVCTKNREGISYKLTTLTAHGLEFGYVSEDSVRVSVDFCPYLMEVYLYQVSDNEAVFHLSRVRHLRVLEIGASQSSKLRFQEALVPLLVNTGANLFSLSLHDIKDIDLDLIGSFCPNIRKLSLSLQEICQTFEHENVNSKSFSNLEELQLTFYSDAAMYTVPEDLLVVYFKNMSKLVSLKMYSVQCFTDAVVLAALAKHGFPCLRRIVLDDCNHVTDKFLSVLIDCDNPLLSLFLHKCRNIALKDVDKLRLQCQRSNLELEIRWD